MFINLKNRCIMNVFIKKRFYQLMVLSAFLLLTGCVTNDFDLSEGINTEITIGGDSLSAPIGSTKPILLGDLIDSLDVDILKRSADGSYAIHMNDSLSVSFNTIDPVNVSIAPISIADINTSVAAIKFPDIKFDPISLSTNVDVPVANTGGLSLPKISTSHREATTITAPSSVKRQDLAGALKNKKAAGIAFGPYEAQGGSSTSQNIPTYVFDNVLKKINTIYFKSNTVNVTFDKSEIRKINFTSYSDQIVLFRVDYPSEFKLLNPKGAGARIEGSSFIIENSTLPDQNSVSFSYDVVSLNLSAVPQNLKLDYNANIPYSVKYRLTGEGEDMSVIGKEVGLSVSIEATPQLSDLDIETNPVILDPSTDTNTISQVVDQLPVEVDVINSLTFEPNASLKLDIKNPGIAPFVFTAGSCIINLPKVFEFKPYAGLNTTTNVLTIPFNQLFEVKNIGIVGVKLNKKVVDKKITVNDELKYSLSGLTVGGAVTKLSTTQSLGQKKINIEATTTGLTVKDASVSTNKISIDIPSQSASFNVNKLVSTDLKKIFTIGLKAPSQIEFKINVSKVPSSVDSIFFENYTITFPTSLKFKTGDVNSSNQVILNRGFKVTEGFTKTLTLQSFDFGTSGLSLVNGYFVFNENVTMAGGAYIKKSTLNVGDLDGIIVSPKINVGSMNIGVMEGLISQAIDPVSEKIDLGLPDMLKGGTNNLDVQNPVITLEIGNTVGIPLDLNLSLIPKLKGVAIPNATVTTKISVAAAETLGKYTFSKYWLAKSSEGVSQGYTAIVLPNLPNLLKVIPDEIEISGTAVITGTKHKVDLYSPKNALNIKYSINVPLDFGKDFKIQYRDTIADLKKSLADYTGLSKKIDLVAVIKNGIPMDLGFSIIPLDENNKVIKGLTFETKDKIASCDINGKPQTTVFNLGVREVESDALKNLNAIDFSINASKNSTVAGIPLKASQSVEVQIRVRIPDGITLKP